MGHHILLWALVLGLFSLANCAGEEAVINLEVRGLPPTARVMPPQVSRLKVAVTPFEDARAKPGLIGTLRHIGGQETPFHVLNGELGEAVALVLIEELKYRKGWDVWLAKPGVTAPDGGPDVTINGRVMGFVANARPWLWFTEITVNMGIVVEAKNLVDGTAVGLVLVGGSSRRLFLFDQEDMEDLLNASLKEGLEMFIEKTKDENRVLRLKQSAGDVRKQLPRTDPIPPQDMSPPFPL